MQLMKIELIHVLIAIAVELGATLVMDLWAIFLKRAFNIPSPNYCFVGRWLRYMPEGIFRHSRRCRGAAKVIRVHRRLDRALCDRRHFRIVARALGLSSVAARAHTSAGDGPWPRHRRNPFFRHAAFVRARHRVFEDAQPYPRQAAKTS